MSFAVGSIVRCRGREWVVLPSEDKDLLLLRPLGGSEEEICGIYLPIEAESIEPAVFPLPDPHRMGDANSAWLLWNAARLNLRNGAGPFRCLGCISVRPRPYQIVPLLMALRLDPVRLLIADDVGVGKTIEAGLIARELLDRGEIKRLAVLCPPYLCEQWQAELTNKFHIPAVVIKSGTVVQLERQLPRSDLSIFEYYPYFVASIDYLKSERYRASFLVHCPELVIVDEAHSCAQPPGRHRVQQQRYELVREIASRADRHLIFLTATPHSGIEESFVSLLGLLKPEFRELKLSALSEQERIELAKHLVQRRRADVKRWLGEETPFPERESLEAYYELSDEYNSLFQDVYNFAREIVKSGETLTGWRQRIRYWTALALLRCVMSSPAAAEATLLARAERLSVDEEMAEQRESFYGRLVYDSIEEEMLYDMVPANIIDEYEGSLPGRERKILRDFAHRAAKLKGQADTKLAKATEIIKQLLQESYHPIIYCRYIATADYVAEELKNRLSPIWPELNVISITGILSEEERQARVQELSQSPRRVLVATDCLSEGINLQEAFNAVVHYDLPWNPNRLEQREGRIDRFGQASPKVKAILFYGRDNPVDGAVLDVLIRKAISIRRDLGVSVPVPVDSETVMEAVLKSLFLHAKPKSMGEQLTFFDQIVSDITVNVNKAWDQAVKRERESRTRFAQHSIHPDEVMRELEETDAVLGDPKSVERFVRLACERLGAPLRQENGFWLLNCNSLPPAIKSRLNESGCICLSFNLPTPEGVVYVGRNHVLTNALAEYVLGCALDRNVSDFPVARCGVIRTDMVNRRTILLLIRVRYLIDSPRQNSSLLAEEVLVTGFMGRPGQMEWLDESKCLELIEKARPKANVEVGERAQVLNEIFSCIESLSPFLGQLANKRATDLYQAHRRVRRITREGRVKVSAQLPVDILGIYVMMPIPQGVKVR